MPKATRRAFKSYYEKRMESMPELTDLSVIRALCEKYDFAIQL